MRFYLGGGIRRSRSARASGVSIARRTALAALSCSSLPIGSGVLSAEVLGHCRM